MSTTITVNPAPAAPVANFTTNVVSGTAPLRVQFTNETTGKFTSCFWNFGDGTTCSVSSPPVHTYTQAGAYTVTLTATGLGGTNNSSVTIDVTASSKAKAGK